MGNMPGAERDSQGKKTRLAQSLQAWGASSKADARRKALQMKSKDEKPALAPVAKKLTPEQKAQAKARAKKAGRRYPNAYDNMKSGGAKFGKSDKFLREYGDRISPKAEAGYKYLKSGRNGNRAETVVNAGAAGITGAATAYAARDAKRMGLKTKGGRIGAGLAAAGAGLTAWNTVGAARGAKKARQWNKPMKRIEAKAKQRAAAGEYGRDRLVGKAAAHSKQVGAFQRGPVWVEKSDLSKVKLTDKDRRKYTTSEEFKENRARAIGGIGAGLAVTGASFPLAAMGAKDISRAKDESRASLRMMARERRADKRSRTSGLPQGPREVKPNRKGVYDIRSEANSKKPKDDTSPGRKKWDKANGLARGGRAKLAAGLVAPIAGLGTTAAINVTGATKHENKVKRRKLADMKAQGAS